MEKDEKRAIRREWINYYLQVGHTSRRIISLLVRFAESENYGMELKYG
jgi:hypothetical protein